MTQHRYQNGSLTKRSNRSSEDVWQFRFYETTLEGRRSRKSISVGKLAQFPTKSDALRVIEPLRIRLNLYHRFGRPVSIGALMDHYVEHELPQRRHSTQQSHSSTLNRWIRPRWGDSCWSKSSLSKSKSGCGLLPWHQRPRSTFEDCFTSFTSMHDDGN
jgi:integrase